MQHHRNFSLENIVAEIKGIVYEESWKNIGGYEKLYAVSTFGRIKKLGRWSKGKPRKWIADKIVAAVKTKRGYLRITLRKNGKKKGVFVHRLVGFAFIPLVEGKPDINHDTGIKTDNHVSQLEWCTPQENNEHGVRMGLLKRGINIKPYVKKGRSHVPKAYKKIIDINTGKTYNSALELSAETGMLIKTIRRMLSGERINRTPYRYVGMESVLKKPVDRKEYSPIGVFDMNWKLVKRFEYKSEAADFVGCKPTDINSFLKGEQSMVKGHKFKMVGYDESFIEPTPFIPYVRPPKKIKVKKPASPPKEVVKYEVDGNEIQRFGSIGDAAKSINEEKKAFRNALRRNKRGYYKGFIYKIVEECNT